MHAEAASQASPEMAALAEINSMLRMLRSVSGTNGGVRGDLKLAGISESKCAEFGQAFQAFDLQVLDLQSMLEARCKRAKVSLGRNQRKRKA